MTTKRVQLTIIFLQYLRNADGLSWNLDLSVSILTMGNWPTYPPTEVIMPPQVILVKRINRCPIGPIAFGLSDGCLPGDLQKILSKQAWRSQTAMATAFGSLSAKGNIQTTGDSSILIRTIACDCFPNLVSLGYQRTSSVRVSNISFADV